ncbi:MAG: pyridoxamine 5'-phosphate oxidase family protein [Bacteroidia bacterium]
MSLLDLAKEELLKSNVDKKHPFKLLSLATHGPDFPQVRTVVKRHCDAQLNLLIYTDSRANKVEEISLNPNVTVLFYHAKKQLQIRMNAIAKVVENDSDLFKEHLHKVKSSNSTRDYSSALKPGSKIEGDIAYTNEINFSLLRIEPSKIDVLKLNKNGHSRYLFTKQNGLWTTEKLVP